MLPQLPTKSSLNAGPWRDRHTAEFSYVAIDANNHTSNVAHVKFRAPSKPIAIPESMEQSIVLEQQPMIVEPEVFASVVEPTIISEERPTIIDGEVTAPGITIEESVMPFLKKAGMLKKIICSINK